MSPHARRELHGEWGPKDFVDLAVALLVALGLGAIGGYHYGKQQGREAERIAAAPKAVEPQVPTVLRPLCKNLVELRRACWAQAKSDATKQLTRKGM